MTTAMIHQYNPDQHTSERVVEKAYQIHGLLFGRGSPVRSLTRILHDRKGKMTLLINFEVSINVGSNDAFIATNRKRDKATLHVAELASNC
jgi:hypothetical protein